MFAGNQIPALLITVLISVALCEPAHASPYTDYSEYIAQQNYPAALEVARKIIKRPNLILSVTNDKNYLLDIRVIGLQALGYYAENVGLEPGMIEEAQRYYQEAIEFAADNPGRNAEVHYEMALFYSKSDRPGLAIPLMSKALEIYESRRDTFNTIKVFIGWSALYGAMGETALSEHFQSKWLGIAEKYFVLGRRPKDEQKWFAYYDALDQYAAKKAMMADVNALARAWEIMESINENYLVSNAAHYLSGAKLFARAGDHRIAADLLQKAPAAWEDDVSRVRSMISGPEVDQLNRQWEIDLVCARAQVEYDAGLYESALSNGRACDQAWQSVGQSIGAGSHIVLGEIYEAGNDYTNAIRSYNSSIESTEGMRSSFSVSDRAAFFTNPVIQAPYWGLIRVHAKEALKSGTVADFYALLEAKERIRARQFGDMTGPAGATTESFARVRQQLSADTALLDYVLTDTDIVLTAFSHDEQLVELIPYDRKEFQERILSIAASLADPGSDMGGLETSLNEMSQAILEPVLPLIIDKQQLIVISDGELNLVPFELWSIGTSEYEPIIARMAVRYTLALRSLSTQLTVEAGGVEGLFGLGDPVYPDSSMIAGLPSSEIAEATRDSNFLSYFVSLPETRTEVENISEMFAGQSNELFLGERAVESLVKKIDLSRYRYLHFATHGVLGGEIPGIGEPALVLGGEPEEDGFLKASEAQQLQLRARLTTLSACNTGSGKFVQGEGVMGLSRAFLLAGSESVLVSLWPVASHATVSLMLRFYGNLQDGQHPTTALRQAKIDQKGQTPHPFYWAPFILIGQQ